MSEWRETTLGEAAEVLMGQSPPGDSYNETGSGVPFMQGSAEFGAHTPRPVKWCTRPTKVAEAGDLLLSVRAPVGDTNFADQSIATGRGLAIIRATKVTSNGYLRLYIQAFLHELVARSGSGMFASITSKELRALRIALPPVVEQRRIADAVQAVDLVIEALGSEAEALDEVRAGVVEEVLAEAQGEDVTLGEVLEIVRGGSPRPIHDYFTEDPNGLNWVKIGDVPSSGKYVTSTKQRITPSGLNKTRFILAGSFILSNSMSFGRPYIMKIDGCIHDGWLALTDEAGRFDQDFLYYLLRSRGVQQQFDRLAAGSGVRNLNIKVVGSVTVRLPDLPEQHRVVQQLNSLHQTGDALRQELDAAIALRASLSSALLHREIEIPGTFDRLLDGVA